MDDLNTPLGQKPEQEKPTRSLPASTIMAGLALMVAGGAMAWTYLGRPQEPPKVAAIPAKTDKPVDGQSLRNTTHKPGKTQTTSDPSKPARLEEMKPTGELVQPKITFLHPKASNNSLRLSHRPEPALLVKSAGGSLPRISRSGRKPMDAYARPSPGGGTYRIAIVVGGVGLSQSGSKSAIEQLPGNVTLAFAPYGNSLRRWMEKARRDGHELLMQVPMEPIGYPQINPGKHTLITGVGAADNIKALHWTMSRMTNYVGMMNYLGAKISNEPAALQPVFEEISKRGLLYLDDGSAFASKAASVAKNADLPFLSGSIVLDDGRSSSLIKENLQMLEKIARRRGHAIGIASAFPNSVKQITRWIKLAEKRGIEIVPVSALVR